MNFGIASTSHRKFEFSDDHPLGIADLRSRSEIEKIDAEHVRCYVRGCDQRLRVHRRDSPGDYCRQHDVRCYLSTAGPTFEYRDPEQNLIIGREEFTTYVRRNPFKYESHRFGLERSEDALSWNFFLGLWQCDLLPWFVFETTGVLIARQPRLFLWGLEVSRATWEPWALLVQARKHFESNLPVDRPLTEPDAAILVPGQLLMLIEVKFCSANPWYKQGPRASSSSLTLDELKKTYQFPGMTSLLMSNAEREPRLPYQLWRNMVFAEWMANADSSVTEPFLLNLVRRSHDHRSHDVLSSVIDPRFQHRLLRLDWEHAICAILDQGADQRLVNYLATKTAGLRLAFGK